MRESFGPHEKIIKKKGKSRKVWSHALVKYVFPLLYTLYILSNIMVTIYKIETRSVKEDTSAPGNNTYLPVRSMHGSQWDVVWRHPGLTGDFPLPACSVPQAGHFSNQRCMRDCWAFMTTAHFRTAYSGRRQVKQQVKMSLATWKTLSFDLLSFSLLVHGSALRHCLKWTTRLYEWWT